ncbi:MAG TPA: ABC transporter permease, partial [Ktedonobacteraceae bacterium]
MIQFFGIPLDALTRILVVITAVIVAGILLLAVSNVLFFKIGVRNIFRRRTQMALIACALMLSTMLLSCVLAVGDVMTATVQSVAIYNWGNIDELIGGGYGPLGTYSEQIYYHLVEQSRNVSNIASVGAALQEDNLLVADQTSRQVRSTVTALAVLPDSERGFGGMQDISTKQYLSIAGLKSDQVYLNQTIAQLLNAKPGDILYLYSQRWPGRRYMMRVAAIIDNGGLVGDNPYVISQLQTFQSIENVAGQINRIFVANRGGGVNSVNLSEQVTNQLHRWLPRHHHIPVIQVKAQGVQNSLKAQDIFSRIFSLFSLFALAIGLLLIFLIFVLLAAERRGEMGMVRAIGVQRYHLVLMYLFEGSVYDLFASLMGLLFGLGIDVLLVHFLEPILARFNFPLKFALQPHSLIIAYCLGVIFTFGSVAISSWLVSRMTVVAAMRDLPEPNRSVFSFSELRRKFASVRERLVSSLDSDSHLSWLDRIPRHFLAHIPDIVIGIIRELTMLGLIPLLVGAVLMQFGLTKAEIIPFSLGLSLLILGGGLLVKAVSTQIVMFMTRFRSKEQSHRKWDWYKVASSVFAALAGSAIVAYWALPFDVLERLGLPRFRAGIEVFFVAGMMMVLGAAWVLMSNAGLFVNPLLALCARLPGLFYTLAKLASVYPLHRRFRTGLSLVMFSLVVFAMTVMSIITNAMQNT